ncbi:MAG TPA: hypothetical protein VGT41_06025 [Candidatus Babeliales bacterium]|nr:hypothetical protein [Candidatus Babeliales bacterium]
MKRIKRSSLFVSLLISTPIFSPCYGMQDEYGIPSNIPKKLSAKIAFFRENPTTSCYSRETLAAVTDYSTFPTEALKNIAEWEFCMAESLDKQAEALARKIYNISPDNIPHCPSVKPHSHLPPEEHYRQLMHLSNKATISGRKIYETIANRYIYENNIQEASLYIRALGSHYVSKSIGQLYADPRHKVHAIQLCFLAGQYFKDADFINRGKELQALYMNAIKKNYVPRYPMLGRAQTDELLEQKQARRLLRKKSV